jgi:hypothetical protein
MWTARSSRVSSFKWNWPIYLKRFFNSFLKSYFLVVVILAESHSLLTWCHLSCDVRKTVKLSTNRVNTNTMSIKAAKYVVWNESWRALCAKCVIWMSLVMWCPKNGQIGHKSRQRQRHARQWVNLSLSKGKCRQLRVDSKTYQILTKDRNNSSITIYTFDKPKFTHWRAWRWRWRDLWPIWPFFGHHMTSDTLTANLELGTTQLFFANDVY